ncbi:calcium-binding protein [Azospirillum argentinense]|nr:calcium-binding protein [Azospirillum argentinense]
MHVDLNLWEIERVFGGGGDDVFDARNAFGVTEIDGGAGNDWLIGGFGDATLRGGAGNDTIEGGFGANLLLGGAGNDLLIGSFLDETLRGGAGNDTLQGSRGADLLVGGAGIDTVDYSHSIFGGVTVDLATGIGSGSNAEGDRLSGIENVIGSSDSDILIGNAAANRLEGGGGYDTLYGGDGDDTLIGGGGHTLMFGGDGADTFRLGFYEWGTYSLDDFESGVDRIELEGWTFGLPDGALAPGVFALDMATDADDRIIFDSMRSSLFYDADGNGSGAAVMIASFNSGTSLSAADIVVVPAGS